MKQELIEIEKERGIFEWNSITPEDNLSCLELEFDDSGEIIKKEWK